MNLATEVKHISVQLFILVFYAVSIEFLDS